MKKLVCLVLLISLTGCCTYQKDYKLDEGQDKAKVEKEYKQCLASEFMATLKFWWAMATL